MQKVLISMVVGLSLVVAVVAVADKELPVFKKGETLYVCGCGSGCDCLTVSRKEGKCTCGNKLVATSVDKVEGDQIFVKVKGQEQAFATKAKYACACGEGCACGTISQKPGKCSCGKEMKRIE